jgi:hypothetical protein
MRIFTVGRNSMQKLAPFAAAKKASSPSHRLFNNSASRASRINADNPPLYERLKRAEREQFDKKRTRVHFLRNDTCALALDFSDEQLAGKFDDEEGLLSLCKNYIIEHASRRIDLFFYALIAYYETAKSPVQGYTNFQYGIGRNFGFFGTQACHSSFTPSLLDETVLENGHTPIKYKSLLSRTHFSQSLNATVELPAFVNAFDDILESIFRPVCFAILREVSIAKINPIEGLTYLLSDMDIVLQDFKQQALEENYASLVYPKLRIHRYVHPKLIDLVMSGTLACSYDEASGMASDSYVQLLLRMTGEEKKLCEQNSVMKKKIYRNKMLALQKEILESESPESMCSI